MNRFRARFHTGSLARHNRSRTRPIAPEHDPDPKETVPAQVGPVSGRVGKTWKEGVMRCRRSWLKHDRFLVPARIREQNGQHDPVPEMSAPAKSAATLRFVHRTPEANRARA